MGSADLQRRILWKQGFLGKEDLAHLKQRPCYQRILRQDPTSHRAVRPHDNGQEAQTEVVRPPLTIIILVSQKTSYKVPWEWEEEEVNKRGGKTTSKSGQGWSCQLPEGCGEREKIERGGMGCTTTSQTDPPPRLHLLGANWWTFCHLGSKSPGTWSCNPALVVKSSVATTSRTGYGKVKWNEVKTTKSSCTSPIARQKRDHFGAYFSILP